MVTKEEWEILLEDQRTLMRMKGRITFDCFHLKSKKDRVYCDLGNLLSQAKDGSMDKLSVLRGVTSGACKGCLNYEGGE